MRLGRLASDGALLALDAEHLIEPLPVQDDLDEQPAGEELCPLAAERVDATAPDRPVSVPGREAGKVGEGKGGEVGAVYALLIGSTRSGL